MPDLPDLYLILGSTPSATPDQIREAYRERVRVLHPDRFDRTKNPAEWEAANRMLTDLNAAYKVLSDPALRGQYDAFRTEPGASSPRPTKPPRPNPQPATTPASATSAIWGDLLWLIPLFAIAAFLLVSPARDRDRRADAHFESGPARLDLGVADPPAATEPEPVGCEPDVEPGTLPVNGQTWRYDDRPGLAPLEVRTVGQDQYLVRVDEGDRPVAAMLVAAGSAAEMLVPLGTFTVKYATGTGEYWCGQDARFPFGRQTAFSRAGEPFYFTDDGGRYTGYTLELYLQADGNLHTASMSPEEW